MRVAITDAAGPMPNLADDYAPELINAATAFSIATYKYSRLPLRLFEAARMAIAVINGCTVCQAWRTAGHGALLGLEGQRAQRGPEPDEAFYRALLRGDDSLLDERERLAAEFARAMSLDPQGLATDEGLWAQLKAVLGDEEIVDLTYCCAGWIGFGRATHVLGVDALCRLPAAGAEAA
jgi:alkylhydroperoxidase family enzyme